MLSGFLANMNTPSLQNIFIVDNTSFFKFRGSNTVPLHFHDKHLDFILRRVKRMPHTTDTSFTLHSQEQHN